MNTEPKKKFTGQFNCTGCGLCCKSVGAVLKALEENPKSLAKPYQIELKKFPYGVTSTGACEKLDPQTNQCTVYDKRPGICNVSYMWAKHYSKKKSKRAYFDESGVACNKLIVKAGLDEKYHVPAH